MIKAIPLIALLALLAVGCGDSGEGPLSPAAQAAAAPKSMDQLPADMPPQAQASADAATQQAAIAQQQANDPARIKAMQEMQKQRGN